MSTLNLFNAAWYLNQYPDVAATVAAGATTAEKHFREFGMAEGRAPGPLFDQVFYLNSNPDVKAGVQAGLFTAYEHFLNFGAAENRSPLVVFDSAYYLSQNADVAQAVQAGQTTAVAHFLAHGQGEPRGITPFINLQSYLAVNPDVQQAVAAGVTTAFSHLVEFGLFEGRSLGNGLNLALFQGDSVYQAALAIGNADVALARLSAVAPFLPGFVRPEGWKPAPNTPIPLNFKPADGSKLHVPDDINVPEGQTLPDWFDNVRPEPEPGPAPEPEPGPGPGPGPGPAFSVKKTESGNKTVFTFEGETGPISGTLEGTDSIAFSRNGVTAESRINLADWTANTTFINLADEQTLEISAEIADHLSKKAIDSSGASPVQYAAITLGSTGDESVVRISGLSEGSGNSVIMTDSANLAGIDSKVSVALGGDRTNIVVGDSGAQHAVQLEVNAHHVVDWNMTGTGNVNVHLSDNSTGSGVKFSVGTEGNNNFVGGTAQSDIITIAPSANGSGEYHVLAGYGADEIILNKGGISAVSNVVQVRTGQDGGVSDSFYHFNLNAYDTIRGFSSSNSKLKLDAGVSVVSDAVEISGMHNALFSVSNGMATFLNIDPSPSEVMEIDVRVAVLSDYMSAQKGVVGFIHGNSTYILQGDGTAGIGYSDVFIKLAGVLVGNIDEVWLPTV